MTECAKTRIDEPIRCSESNTSPNNIDVWLRHSILAASTALALVAAPVAAQEAIAVDAETTVTNGDGANIGQGIDTQRGPKWNPWASLGGAYGTEESSYGELIIFAPLMQTLDSLTFTEMRAKYFEGDILEGNAAFGHRWMTGSGFNLGIWAGLDVRHTSSDNTFGQVSGGLEALSDVLDARINGYFPFTGPQAAGAGMAEVKLEGSNIFMIGGDEVALHGVDGEIGGRLPLFGNNVATLGLYGGGFWFDNDDAFEAITGGRARVELALNDMVGPGSQITAQYAFTHDNVRGDRHFVGGALRIPFGATKTAASDMTAQEWRMLDGLERDTDIVIGRSGEEPVEDAKTGTDFNEVVRIDADGALSAALGSGPDKLIIVDDIGGAYTGNQIVGAHQTVQGGGSIIQVRGRNSGAVADFTAPGNRPTIDFNGTAPVITVADRVHLAGLDITGGGGSGGGGSGTPIDDNDGVLGGPNMFVAFSDIKVSGVGARGFNFRDADGVSADFDNVWVSDTGSGGINFSIAEGVQASFHEVHVENTRREGIDFSSGEGHMVDFRNVWVSGTGSAGINFSGGDGDHVVTFHEVHVENTDSEGINFSGGEGHTVDFRNVWVSGTGREGIDFSGSGGRHAVTFQEVHIENTGEEGLDFTRSDGSTVNLRDVWIADTFNQGINVQDADGAQFIFDTVTFSGTIGQAGTSDALFLAGATTTLPTINGDIINNTINIPPGDLCQPLNGFIGVVTVTNGTVSTITNGDAC